MRERPVVEGVEWVGAVDWDRRLFDELIPLPDGTSYNAYLVRGSEKTVLMDSVDPSFAGVLLERLASAGVKRLDYVVCHHAEQDHSGAIPRVLERYPEATVLATEKCKVMLGDLLGVPADKVRAVADRERIDLGGLTIEGIHFPWVHWPETMLTWLPERRTLFSCDLFGSHLATSEMFAGNDPLVLPGAKRYYAEIMMPFRNFIQKNMERVTSLEPAFIAPSHGPVHDHPALILDAYHEWLSAPPKNLVVVPYVSMHDSTRRMVEHFMESCAWRGVRAEQFNLGDPDVGKLAMLLVDAASLVIGTPTVLAGPHPKVAYAASLANLIRPKVRFLSVIGSYSWGGKAVEQLAAMIPNLKVEVIPPVLCKGVPKAEDLAALDRLAETLAKKHGTIM
ncbi:MAG: FprA family A-type flavoprotein [Deltaproteobacteria bacterium]|nr:FprA family A-type flavoprotein [Deltaproteobacteria bacterium]